MHCIPTLYTLQGNQIPGECRMDWTGDNQIASPSARLSFEQLTGSCITLFFAHVQ